MKQQDFDLQRLDDLFRLHNELKISLMKLTTSLCLTEDKRHGRKVERYTKYIRKDMDSVAKLLHERGDKYVDKYGEVPL